VHGELNFFAKGPGRKKKRTCQKKALKQANGVE
jgi:hypothetical protein